MPPYQIWTNSENLHFFTSSTVTLKIGIGSRSRALIVSGLRLFEGPQGDKRQLHGSVEECRSDFWKFCPLYWVPTVLRDFLHKFYVGLLTETLVHWDVLCQQNLYKKFLRAINHTQNSPVPFSKDFFLLFTNACQAKCRRNWVDNFMRYWYSIFKININTRQSSIPNIISQWSFNGLIDDCSAGQRQGKGELFQRGPESL